MSTRNRKTIKRFGLAVFLSFIAMVVFPIAVATASCTATPNYDADGNYTGCTTNVDGHEQTSTPEGITELGCNTFCDYVPIGETVDEPEGESGEEPEGETGEEPDIDEPADSGPGPDPLPPLFGDDNIMRRIICEEIHSRMREQREEDEPWDSGPGCSHLYE